MLRSMFSGVSGLRAHQTMMDVVGNNIANVNTTGFKSSQATFAEALTQTVRAAGPGGEAMGGTNPIQIGLGTQVSSIEGVFTQGSMQMTGRSTDIAIQGDGYFVLGQGGNRQYTRAGAFSFDRSGALVTSDGVPVLGWNADATGAVDTTGSVGPIQVPVAQVIEPEATTGVELGGNLSADAAIGDTVLVTSTVYDSLGTALELAVTFEKTATNEWEATAMLEGNTVTVAPSTLTFDASGALTSASPLAISGYTPPGADPLAIDVTLDGSSSLVQFGGSSSPQVYEQDGQAIGFLQDVAIGADGTLIAEFSNGRRQDAGVLATATFANEGGLTRLGDSRFAESGNSGTGVLDRPGTGDRGVLTPGALEMSNVDLAREFTNLIIAQRGFQANSRVITSSDEMLSDLVNIKR